MNAKLHAKLNVVSKQNQIETINFMNFWCAVQCWSNYKKKVLFYCWLKNLFKPIFEDPDPFDSDCIGLKPSLTDLTESARLYEMQVIGCALGINIDDI